MDLDETWYDYNLQEVDGSENLFGFVIFQNLPILPS